MFGFSLTVIFWCSDYLIFIAKLLKILGPSFPLWSSLLELSERLLPRLDCSEHSPNKTQFSNLKLCVFLRSGGNDHVTHRLRPWVLATLLFFLCVFTPTYQLDLSLLGASLQWFCIFISGLGACLKNYLFRFCFSPYINWKKSHNFTTCSA